MPGRPALFFARGLDVAPAGREPLPEWLAEAVFLAGALAPIAWFAVVLAREG